MGKNTKRVNKLNKIPILISVIMLLSAIPPMWPYGYYTLLRLVVCGTAIYLAWFSYSVKKQGFMWATGFIALLFNPLIPVHLSKEIWSFIDLATATIFVATMFKLKKYAK